MSAAHRAAAMLTQRLDVLTAAHGRRVTLDPLDVLDRSADIALLRPGARSPNGHCRMLAASDGWIALNLARPSDLELIPAWIGEEWSGDAWDAAERHAARTSVRDLLAQGILLGLPIAALGEVAGKGLAPHRIAMGAGTSRRGLRTVLDLSSLWAGPLCAGILARMGAQVTRIEDPGRPDPVRVTTPRHYERLNRGKTEISFSLRTHEGRERLVALACEVDAIVTSARPRAFESLGLVPERVFAANPGLVWVAITGHGWQAPHAERVAFGDDAAVAGGLVRWVDGAPRFLGDALADPLTGLAGAVAAIEAAEAGGGVLVDAAMARVAAGAAGLAQSALT